MKRANGVGNKIFIEGNSAAALGAQPAVQADILVLCHDARRLESIRNVNILRQIERRRVQPLAQILLVAVRGERDAVHRADIDASVALDAQLGREHRLRVAVQAAFRFGQRELRIESQFNFDFDVP